MTVQADTRIRFLGGSRATRQRREPSQSHPDEAAGTSQGRSPSRREGSAVSGSAGGFHFGRASGQRSLVRAGRWATVAASIGLAFGLTACSGDSGGYQPTVSSTSSNQMQATEDGDTGKDTGRHIGLDEWNPDVSQREETGDTGAEESSGSETTTGVEETGSPEGSSSVVSESQWDWANFERYQYLHAPTLDVGATLREAGASQVLIREIMNPAGKHFDRSEARQVALQLYAHAEVLQDDDRSRQSGLAQAYLATIVDSRINRIALVEQNDPGSQQIVLSQSDFAALLRAANPNASEDDIEMIAYATERHIEAQGGGYSLGQVDPQVVHVMGLGVLRNRSRVPGSATQAASNDFRNSFAWYLAQLARGAVA